MGLRLIIEDFVDTYSRLLRGEALAEAALSYLDFIAEDRAYLDSQRYLHDRQFWLERYASLPPALIHPSNSDKAADQGQAESVLWQSGLFEEWRLAPRMPIERFIPSFIATKALKLTAQ